MPRPRRLVPQEEAQMMEPVVQAEPAQQDSQPLSYKLGSVVEFGYPIEIMGNKKSVNSRDAEIRIYEWGVDLVSKIVNKKTKTKRNIRVYSSNIKAVEFVG